MLKHHVLQFLVISIAIGVSTDVNGASLDNSAGETLSSVGQRQATLQDLKNYIQPILYQKFLRTPGDSSVVLAAKAVVSEYLADSLIATVNSPQSQVQSSPARQVSKQGTNNNPTGSNNNNNNNILTSAGAQLVQAVAGANRNRTRPSQQHVLNQVDSILQNVNGANITGIVDQALLIRAPAPVRQLVNGILNTVLCNPFNRLWNRCSGGGSLLFPNGPTS